MGGTGLFTLEIMKKIPHFAGKNSLSLTDLQALADAVPPPCPHVQPATATRGRVQYDNADYNLATRAADECSGTAARPDSPGMLATVAYAAADAPYIDSGNMVLPLAHDYSPSDSSLPDESATGGLRGVQVTAGLQRAMINRGLLGLPLAQSSWGDAEGAMYTPGLVYGVQYDPVDDACVGAVLPRIDQGIIHLPAGGGGGELPLLSIEASSDETWGVNGGVFRVGLADMCAGSAGIIARVEAGEHLALSQGVLTVPTGGGSTLSGVVNTSGEQVPWAQMQAAPVRMAVFFLDGYRLYLTGQLVNGFLQFNTEAV